MSRADGRSVKSWSRPCAVGPVAGAGCARVMWWPEARGLVALGPTLTYAISTSGVGSSDVVRAPRRGREAGHQARDRRNRRCGPP